jgi:hypothetical protein
MSRRRRFTLDEYLDRFADKHTEAADDEIMLHVSDAQAQSVGLFFIECMGGILLSLGEQGRTPMSPGISDEHGGEVADEATTDEEEFVN